MTDHSDLCPVCGASRPALTEEMAQPPGSDARCQAECIITNCHCCLTWWQEQERQAIEVEEHLSHWREIERHYREGGEEPPSGVVALRRKWEKRKQGMADQKRMERERENVRSWCAERERELASIGQERIEQEQAYRRAMFHVPEGGQV